MSNADAYLGYLWALAFPGFNSDRNQKSIPCDFSSGPTGRLRSKTVLFLSWFQVTWFHRQ